jgi:hypothetical protein
MHLLQVADMLEPWLAWRFARLEADRHAVDGSREGRRFERGRPARYTALGSKPLVVRCAGVKRVVLTQSFTLPAAPILPSTD